MASIKQTRSGSFQLCVKNKLLPKTLWATFDTYEQAEQYGAQLERLLAQGIVPASLLVQEPPKRAAWTIARCITEYIRNNAVPLSDVKLLDTVTPELGMISTSNLNYDWADSWVTSMKREANLAPSTIRHRHGALARCFDWMTRKHPDVMVQNPLRLLKRGFATYTDHDAAILAKEGRHAREDVERDRRLLPEEEKLLVAALKGDDRVFFILVLETAMRMRECYTLDLTQVNLVARTIYLDRSKNGTTDRFRYPVLPVRFSLSKSQRAKQRSGRVEAGCSRTGTAIFQFASSTVPRPRCLGCSGMPSTVLARQTCIFTICVTRQPVACTSGPPCQTF